MFQCPTSGFSLFYTEESKSELMTAVRFNALLRAFLFSTKIKTHSKLTLTRFQCPTSGFSLFYNYIYSERSKWKACFNALLRAFLFSTRRYENMKYYDVAMFQCPTSGFSLFYTMALQPLILLALQIHFCV